VSAPYWQSPCGRVVLHHGDCLDVLPTLPPESAGFVCSDPPYAEATHADARSGKAPKKRGGLVTFASLTADDIRARFAAAGRVVSRWLVATMEFRHAAALEAAPPDGYLFIRCGVWTKPDGAPQFTGDRPAQGWESIAILHRLGSGRLKWNGGGRSSVFHHNVQRSAEYPTQKPLALVREFVELFSDPGDVVLDPFCGSGTTLVAALERGRRAIGIDIDERALSIARTRCEVVLKQGALFGGAA
jgi:site-specific DNA-methyltransferase (adenine-specific)